ncbi:MAG: hypothetical protein ACTSVZ_02575 [Promethearchaeota archaeon]
MIIGGLFIVGGIIFIVIIAFLTVGEDGYVRPDANAEIMILGLIPVAFGMLIIIVSFGMMASIVKKISNPDSKHGIKPNQLEREQTKQRIYNQLQAKSGVDNYFIHKTIDSHKKRLAKKHLSLADEEKFWNRANLILPHSEPTKMLNFHKIRLYIKFFYDHDATTPETAIPLNQFLEDHTFANSQTTMYIANEVINYRQDCSVYLNVPKIKFYCKLFAGGFAVVWAIFLVISYFLPNSNWIIFVVYTVVIVPVIFYYAKLGIYLQYYKQKFQNSQHIQSIKQPKNLI